MTEFILSEIYIYPIKSAAGVSLKKASVVEKGLELDRKWMLVDDEGKFISQRTCHELSLINVEILSDGLAVKHKTRNLGELFIPFEADEEFTIPVKIWNDECRAVLVGNAADCWFSKALGITCRLVFMHDNIIRPVDPQYSTGNETVGFADGFPFLLIGQSSLDNLNSKLEKHVSIKRFRPNIVFKGGEPFAEDNWRKFKIGRVTFFPVKPCARCIVTTIDQDTGEIGNEPLQTLSSFRKKNNKVLFGQNLIHEGIGKIKVGDSLNILE